MLYVCRKHALVEQVFKILNGISLPVESSCFERQCTPYSIRYDFKLKKTKYNTIQYGFKSLSYQGAYLWNSLPVTV